jgi:hypothetical protein
MWVVDEDGNSVAELDSVNGSLEWLAHNAKSDFDEPDGIALDGSHLWVVNGKGDTVTELDASNGKLIRVIR